MKVYRFCCAFGEQLGSETVRNSKCRTDETHEKYTGESIRKPCTSYMKSSSIHIPNAVMRPQQSGVQVSRLLDTRARDTHIWRATLTTKSITFFWRNFLLGLACETYSENLSLATFPQPVQYLFRWIKSKLCVHIFASVCIVQLSNVLWVSCWDYPLWGSKKLGHRWWWWRVSQTADYESQAKISDAHWCDNRSAVAHVNKQR